jgi:hypothetical protein
MPSSTLVGEINCEADGKRFRRENELKNYERPDMDHAA